MFGNESQLMRRRRSVVAIIVAASVFIIFSSFLVTASSSYETDGWFECYYNNEHFPAAAPFYWLRKAISGNGNPKVEIKHLVPGGVTEKITFDGHMETSVDLSYGETRKIELLPGTYEFRMENDNGQHTRSKGILIEEGWDYKLIYAPKEFRPVENLPPTEFADSNEQTSYQPTTAMPTAIPPSTITEHSAETATAPSTNTVPAQQNTTTRMIKLVGGSILLLAIALIASKFYGKRQRVPEKPAVSTATEPAPLSPPKPTPTEKDVAIEIKRGYEVLQNNDLRFGIHIINNTDYVILDVQTILDYPKTLFSLKGTEIQTLANIRPNGERTAKYTLAPLGCIHNEKIDAIVRYKDHTGETHTVQMRSKEVHCVCPFLKEKPMHEGEFAELAAKSKQIAEGLSFSGISPSEIAAFIKESCTHRLHTVGEHEIDNTIVLNLAGESIGEKAYYLLTAVIQPYKDKDVTQIALIAYSDKPHGLHGFLNEITGSVRHLVGSVQSAKEIGIIEEKQVINIIDSVVQRTSFGGAGQSGSTEVNIKDSIVHRSDVGGGSDAER